MSRIRAWGCLGVWGFWGLELGVGDLRVRGVRLGEIKIKITLWV